MHPRTLPKDLPAFGDMSPPWVRRPHRWAFLVQGRSQFGTDGPFDLLQRREDGRYSADREVLRHPPRETLIVALGEIKVCSEGAHLFWRRVRDVGSAWPALQVQWRRQGSP